MKTCITDSRHEDRTSEIRSSGDTSWTYCYVTLVKHAFI